MFSLCNGYRPLHFDSELPPRHFVIFEGRDSEVRAPPITIISAVPIFANKFTVLIYCRSLAFFYRNLKPYSTFPLKVTKLLETIYDKAFPFPCLSI